MLSSAAKLDADEFDFAWSAVLPSTLTKEYCVSRLVGNLSARQPLGDPICFWVSVNDGIISGGDCSTATGLSNCDVAHPAAIKIAVSEIKLLKHIW